MDGVTVRGITGIGRVAGRILDKHRSDEESATRPNRVVGSDCVSAAFYPPYFLVRRWTKGIEAYSLDDILSLESMARKTHDVNPGSTARPCSWAPELIEPKPACRLKSYLTTRKKCRQ